MKNALRIGSLGEIRDRTSEAQHFQVTGLNLLVAIIIYWNADQHGGAIRKRQRVGLWTSENLLSPNSPLGWEHIMLTGE